MNFSRLLLKLRAQRFIIECSVTNGKCDAPKTNLRMGGIILIMRPIRVGPFARYREYANREAATHQVGDFARRLVKSIF